MDLPILPRGQGNMRMSRGRIRYEKIYESKITKVKKRLSVTCDSVGDCFIAMQKKEEEFEKSQEIARRHSTDNQTVIVDYAMREWLYNEKRGNVKATTYDRVERTAVNQICSTYFGKLHTIQVTSEDINKHLHWLQYDSITERGKKGYSLSVLNKVYDIFSEFFSWYYSKDLNNNPMNNVCRPTEKRTDELDEDSEESLFDNDKIKDMVLSDEEIRIFRDWVYAEHRPFTQGSSRYGKALYFVMLTFIRSGEARALRWKDIDIDHARMQITKSVSRVLNRDGDGGKKTRIIVTTPKTERGKRIVQLTDEAVRAITDYKRECVHTRPNDFVFGTDAGERVTETQIAEVLNGILYASGLKYDRAKAARYATINARRKVNGLPPIELKKAPVRDGFSMHYLRHTGISYYLRHGVPVDIISKMAGHSSSDITKSIYYHIINDQEVDALSAMNKIKL